MVNYNLILDFYSLKKLFFMFIAWQTMNVEDILDVITENDEENSESAKTQNEASAADDIKSKNIRISLFIAYKLLINFKIIALDDSSHKTMQ